MDAVEMQLHFLGEEKDDLLEDAIKIIIENNIASTSIIQRRLKLGYRRACRIIDQLEQCGFIGKANGAKPREILITNLDGINFDPF